jgi:hypothetical protein
MIARRGRVKDPIEGIKWIEGYFVEEENYWIDDEGGECTCFTKHDVVFIDRHLDYQYD